MRRSLTTHAAYAARVALALAERGVLLVIGIAAFMAMILGVLVVTYLAITGLMMVLGIV